nr:MAG TPA: hypothetical protein [Bacteriophage sp.]
MSVGWSNNCYICIICVLLGTLGFYLKLIPNF